jgi:membrane-anchored protein YejM (alkaline phosphatase superfamily)
MVYGHTTTWEQKTGIGIIDYYNRYFNKTINALEENNLLDKALIIVTSDHGPRFDAYKVDNYHIPLMIYAKDIEHKEDSKFLSHLDFKSILFELATNIDYTYEQTPIYTMGNSGELIYGMIAPDGRYAFINNRSGYSKNNLTKEDLNTFSNDFQAYMNYFEYLKEFATPSNTFLYSQQKGGKSPGKSKATSGSF